MFWSTRHDWRGVDMNTETPSTRAVRWIEALQANEHKQGIGHLGDSEMGFCCLGLACEVNELPFYECQLELSNPNMNAIGLKHYVGLVQEGKSFLVRGIQNIYLTLADLNDRARLSFPEIAEIIIDRADDLFVPDVAVSIREHFKEAA